MPKKIGKITRHNKAISREKKLLEVESEKFPRSIIYNGHDVNTNLKKLTHDFKLIYEPYTTTSLKCSKKNSVKDFIDMAGPLNAKTIMFIDQNKGQPYLHIISAPQGPRFLFRILEYSLAKDHQKETDFCMNKNWLNYAPVLQLIGFRKSEHYIKAVEKVFQNMFPSINVLTTNLSNIKRVVNIKRVDNYSDINENKSKTGEIFIMKQYYIKLDSKAVNKNLKKIGIGIQSKNFKIPDLSKYGSMKDYLESCNLSESDMSDNECIELTENVKELSGLRGRTAVKLIDIGPSLVLSLIRIEDAVEHGTILYHNTMNETEMSIVNSKREATAKKEKAKQKKREQLNQEKLKEKQAKHSKKDKEETKESDEEVEDIDDENLSNISIDTEDEECEEEEESLKSEEVTDDEIIVESEVESESDVNQNYDSDDLVEHSENDNYDDVEVEPIKPTKRVLKPAKSEKPCKKQKFN